MLATETPPESPARASWRGWAGVRAFLLVVTVVIVFAALVWGERSASLEELHARVSSGDVSVVKVSGGLLPGATGTDSQEVHWRDGWRSYRAQVQLVLGSRDPGSAMTGDDGQRLPLVHQDVADLVRSWNPGVRTEGGRNPLLTGSVLGLAVPDWVGILALAHWVAALFLLVNGPAPRRATRWAWFWLLSQPFGVTAFLLFSGPLPGRPFVAPGPRRLTGGWSFLITLALSAVIGGSSAL